MAVHLWSRELEARLDAISQALPGFCIGRYDIRFSSIADLQAGRGFKILELNGAASEATSAYDSSKSLRQAYGLLFRQWELVFAIGVENRQHGHRPDPISRILREWLRYQRYSLCYPLAD